MGSVLESAVKERYVWSALAGGAAFLVAAVISVALSGPGWPYYLVLGVLALVAAFFLSTRKDRPSQP